MEKQGQGDSYYTRPYKINPKVRELLNKKLGNKDLSYMEVENIINSVMSAKYKKTLKELTDKDKVKLMNMLKEKFGTNLPEKNVDVIVSFLTDNYTEDEIKDFVDYILTMYKPGGVYMGVKISNHTIIYFLEKLNVYPLMKGIIINKKYVNDLIVFFNKEGDDFDYDKETLMVETDYTDDMIEIFKDLSETIEDIRFHTDDNIFILGTFDDEVAKQMKDSFDGLQVQSIPVHKFNWKG